MATGAVVARSGAGVLPALLCALCATTLGCSTSLGRWTGLGAPAPEPSAPSERVAEAERCLQEADEPEGRACRAAFVERFSAHDPAGLSAEVFAAHAADLLAEGELQRTRRALRRALDLSRVAGAGPAREATLLLRLARVEASLGSERKALEALEGALAREPADPVLQLEIHLELARLLELRGDPDGARDALRSAEPLAGEGGGLLVAPGVLAAGRLHQASPEALERALSAFGAARVGSLEDAESLATAFAQVISELLSRGAFEAALRESERALGALAAAPPTAGRVSSVLRVRRLEALAVLGPAERTFGACAELLDEPAHLDPAPALRAYAVCADTARDLEENAAELAWIEAAGQVDGELDAPAAADLGRLLQRHAALLAASEHASRRELLERSLEVLERADVAPRLRATVSARLGALAVARGQGDEAIALAANAIKLFSSLESPPLDLVTMAGEVLAVEQLKAGKLVDAEVSVGKTLRVLGPATPETSLSHARLLYVRSRSELIQTRYDAALASGREALELLEASREPASSFRGVLLNHLGFVHMRLGRYEAAASLYQEALAILSQTNAPQDLEHVLAGLLNLGALFANEGRRPEAIAVYAEILRAYEALRLQDTPAYVRALFTSVQLNFDEGRFAAAHHQAQILFRLVQARPDSSEKIASLARISALLRRIRLAAQAAEAERQEQVERATRPGPPSNAAPR